jgi:hypothetical protein
MTKIIIHTIPIPRGWSIEQAWEAICRGDLLRHKRKKPPMWANVVVDEKEKMVRVLR